MDDLHDAIENARYEECISSMPSPILMWSFPDDETLERWKVDTLKAYHKKAGLENSNNPQLKKYFSRDVKESEVPFTLEWTLANSIGFFLFCTFVWDMSKADFAAQFNTTEVADDDNDDDDDDEWSPRPSTASHNNRSSVQQESTSIAVESSSFTEGRDSENTNMRKSFGTHFSKRSLFAADPDLPPDLDAEFEGRYAKIKFLIDVVRFQRIVQQVNDGDTAARYSLQGKVNHLMERYILARSYEGRKNLDHLGKDYRDIARVPSQHNLNIHDYNTGAYVHASSRRPGLTDESSENISRTQQNDGGSGTDFICCLGLGGQPLFETIQQAKKGAPYAMNMFDKIEIFVVYQLKQRYWDLFVRSEHFKRFLNFVWFKDRKVVEDDFIPIRKLGRGGFGLVHACKKGTSGKLFAMKAMNKRRVKLKKAEKLVLNERIVLASVKCPFVVNLNYAFQSKDHIFLILDLMTGGDLSYHLSRKGRFNIPESRYYAACTMLGIEALHNEGFVYRDLKPENILMGDDGRVKITDMGLACKITAGLHGACGTRGYWAPEMLRRDARGKRKSYGHTVDWFSFGCMLAEFLSGVNPFRSEKALNFGFENGHQTKEAAIDCATLEMEPEFDSTFFDTHAADLCKQLLNKDEKKRIGAENGCRDIMEHPWFSEMDWELIMSNQQQPPFLPAREVNAAAQSVIGEFEEDKKFRSIVLEEKDLQVYREWDWTNPAAYYEEIVEFLAYERKLGRPLLPVGMGDGCCCAIS
mmetsp:Transcript_3693/g.5700  ORF Transcript_3693/g.5700 Transcript_3693/m.5700 type:complete len:753 (-) Transcript_3693:431-2689(-)